MEVPDIIKQAARQLRQKQTPSEKILWDMLRRNYSGIKIYRQKPIFVFQENSGLYRFVIADFYYPEAKCIIEIDGSIHNKEEIYLLDKYKEDLLKNRGFHILRFTNQQVLENTTKVIEHIAASSFSSYEEKELR